jgi:hypothetical protein
MKTYVINSIEDLKQFENNGKYIVDGNLEVNCSLNIENKNVLSVDGYLFVKPDRYIKRYIQLGGSIETRGSIYVDGFIYADGSIYAGSNILAGNDCGITAGLSIKCTGKLYCGLKILAGTSPCYEITDEEKTITCGKLEGGIVAYGILVETGIKKDESKTQEAIKLLKSKGYKIIKE